jgi:hypothetical protein
MKLTPIKYETAMATPISPRRKFRLIPMLGILLFGLLVMTCKQSAIFYDISQEEAPTVPRIMGGPSKIVHFKNALYVASGDIQRYKANSWENVESPPGGKVKDLAATDTYLYALNITGADLNSSALYRSSDGATWEGVEKDKIYVYLQGIYGTEDVLFAGARNGDGNNALFYETGGKLVLLKGGLDRGGEIRGAAKSGGAYYLATTGQGIWAGTLPDIGAVTVPSDIGNVTGISRVGSAILAVTSNGQILKIPGTAANVIYESSTINFTGAMGIYEDPDNTKDPLLLLGIQTGSSVYTYGYREIVLTGGEINDSPDLLIPGEGDENRLSTLRDRNTPKYNASLGKHSLTSILQAPQGVDTNMTLFAVTTKAGLWSYRDRSNWQWNAEE